MHDTSVALPGYRAAGTEGGRLSGGGGGKRWRAELRGRLQRKRHRRRKRLKAGCRGQGVGGGHGGSVHTGVEKQQRVAVAVHPLRGVEKGA